MLDRIDTDQLRYEVFMVGVPPISWGTVHGPDWELVTIVGRRAERPVWRYRHRESTTVVSVATAGAWFGDDCTVAGAALAYDRLAAVLRGMGQPAPLLLPAMTGRDLWTRHIPEGDGWPVLDEDLQQFIRSTSGQGRVEYFPHGTPDGGGMMYELDGRMMYGALCALLPTGKPQFIDGPAAKRDEWDMAQQRALVEWSAPVGWDHVGILPAKRDSRGWCYPTRGVGWVDGAELHLARRHGWDVKIHERIVWPGNGRPLDGFARKLVRARENVTDHLVAGALRRVLVDTIGSFQGRASVITHHAPLTVEIPDDLAMADLRIEGDRMVWETTKPKSRFAALASHPEWTAAIWGRSRARILDSPTGQKTRAGVLHLEPETVLAILTDSIVTTTDPRWPDDGRAGRLRNKSRRRVERWPTTASELHKMKGP